MTEKVTLVTSDVKRKDVLRLIDTYAKHFEEGDIVETPEGLGVVSAVWEQTWETDDGETIEASSDNPAYTVALESGGFGHFSGDELEEGPDDAFSNDVDDPVGELAESQDTMSVGTQMLDTYDFNAPESWEESERPVRIIALDVWSSMNGQFDCRGGGCCKGTMRQAGMSENASDEFCASFKDFILGTEQWRGWGPD